MAPHDPEMVSSEGIQVVATTATSASADAAALEEDTRKSPTGVGDPTDVHPENKGATEAATIGESNQLPSIDVDTEVELASASSCRKRPPEEQATPNDHGKSLSSYISRSLSGLFSDIADAQQQQLEPDAEMEEEQPESPPVAVYEQPVVQEKEEQYVMPQRKRSRTDLYHSEPDLVAAGTSAEAANIAEQLPPGSLPPSHQEEWHYQQHSSHRYNEHHPQHHDLSQQHNDYSQPSQQHPQTSRSSSSAHGSLLHKSASAPHNMTLMRRRSFSYQCLTTLHLLEDEDDANEALVGALALPEHSTLPRRKSSQLPPFPADSLLEDPSLTMDDTAAADPIHMLDGPPTLHLVQQQQQQDDSSRAASPSSLGSFIRDLNAVDLANDVPSPPPSSPVIEQQAQQLQPQQDNYGWFVPEEEEDDHNTSAIHQLQLQHNITYPERSAEDEAFPQPPPQSSGFPPGHTDRTTTVAATSTPQPQYSRGMGEAKQMKGEGRPVVQQVDNEQEEEVDDAQRAADTVDSVLGDFFG